MVQNLEGLGFTVVPFGQGYKDMLLTLEEAKQHIRTDYPDDDSLTEDLIAAAEELVKAAGRFTGDTLAENAAAAKAAEYYAVAYLYEHREDADMLFGDLRIDEYELGKIDPGSLEIIAGSYPSTNVKRFYRYIRRNSK